MAGLIADKEQRLLSAVMDLLEILRAGRADRFEEITPTSSTGLIAALAIDALGAILANAGVPPSDLREVLIDPPKPLRLALDEMVERLEARQALLEAYKTGVGVKAAEARARRLIRKDRANPVVFLAVVCGALDAVLQMADISLERFQTLLATIECFWPPKAEDE